MVDGCGQGSVERVEERWVEGTEGKFVDDVREIKRCAKHLCQPSAFILLETCRNNRLKKRR